MPVQAVIWDIGGVLVRTEDRGPRTRLAERLGMTYAEVNTDAGKAIIYPLRLQYGASDSTELFAVLANSVSASISAGWPAHTAYTCRSSAGAVRV